MFFDSVLPLLEKEVDHSNGQRDEYSIYLTPESKLEDIVAKHAPQGIVWGTRVQDQRISLYISGKSKEDRAALISALKNELGEHLVQDGDVEILTSFTSYLKEHAMKVSCAESCTGGLVGKLLTDTSGSSDYFHSSLVTYANEAKSTFLDIDSAVIEQYGAVSEEVVSQMAQQVLEKSGSDVSIAISGIAGPNGGSDEKPVGTVWFGFASKILPNVSICLHFSSFGRASVRRRAAIASLLLGYLYLNGVNLLDIPSSWQYI
jgi:nicotinamide-nucleotide amidase